MAKKYDNSKTRFNISKNEFIIYVLFSLFTLKV